MTNNIKQLTLVFPHGATQKQCDDIAHRAQRILGCGVSAGGFSIKSYSLGDDGVTFAEDEMTYVYGHKREKADG